jgi:hypothetical protein
VAESQRPRLSTFLNTFFEILEKVEGVVGRNSGDRAMTLSAINALTQS